MKDIDEYGKFVDRMWFGSPEDEGRTELTERDMQVMFLGLSGEVGEIMEKRKKQVRDGTYDAELFKKELGDAAFYLCRICSAYGFKPSEVLQANIDKLEDRKARGTRRGSGDTR